MKRLFSLTFLFFSLSFSYAQVSIKGKVTDAETGDPIPFASVLVLGTGKGMNTDFEGNYELSFSGKADSVRVSYLGYITQTKKIGSSANQTINFQLRPSDFELEAFVFEAGENPAFEIIRRAVDKRKVFDT